MTSESQPGLTRDQVIAVRDACLCLHVQRAARALARQFDEAFRPFGLTNGQFSLLMALHQENPPTIGKLAPFLAMDRTTLTAALKPLERRGLVVTKPGEKDRRARHLHLTPEGRALMLRAHAVWVAAHAQLDTRLLAEGIDPDAMRAGLTQLARPPADPPKDQPLAQGITG
ncbi:MarR family transcriptional regulator [Tabrizicola sp. DMG-N-6]|uniref:MarR family transcriptional regulator n=2 Tax=Szabonella alba TaxID=2804194 RepID=A0A8K0XZZ8_9RHOB|nr:MarR family transcriptional regulator [Szabonella alba]